MTLSEGVSTPIASAMLDSALEYTSSSPLIPIGGPNVYPEQRQLVEEKQKI